MGKEQFKANKVGMRIDKLTFAISDPLHLRRQSLIQCTNKRFYEDPSSNQLVAGAQAQPQIGGKATIARNGVLDLALGTSTTSNACRTCGQRLATCIGHFGHIELPLPCYHTGYFRFILLTLSAICRTCARLLMPKDKRSEYLTKVLRAKHSYLERKALHEQIIKLCKKQKTCPYCGAFNGQIKKTGCYKILSQNVPIKPKTKNSTITAYTKEQKQQMSKFKTIVDANPELEELLEKQTHELLDPIVVLDLFRRIPDRDIPFLLISDARPEDLILTRLPVPPSCIRPTVVSDENTNEDDLTILLSETNLLADVIEKRRATGAIPSLVMEAWDFLQLEIALYINSETSGIPLQNKPKKATRGLVQRLKGKHGRFRGNLSGKRVDFSSRSVISPNPMLGIDQVGVPKHVAKLLTYPERVTPHNIALMQKFVRNGPKEYPGANYILDPAGNRRFLMYGNREWLANNLKPGDIVERHMIDGDCVLFNRQPSLHKQSIMCHRAKIHDNRTLQFNECVCTPYNADFDGDEMNLHLLQTEEAKAEAAVLMGTKKNIVTPRNGEPLIAAIQDFITGSYLLTQKDVFFDRAEAQQIISSTLASVDNNIPISFPPPCVIKPRALWSGKQIFSMIIRPSKESRILLNTQCKTKNYSGRDEDLCRNDGFVVVRNSELLCGQLDKTILGSGSKSNVFYLMLKDYSGDDAGDALCRLARTISNFMANRGFSLGIDDVTPTTSLESEKLSLLTRGYETVRKKIIEEKEGRLEAEAGSTRSETLEAIILKELSSIREAAGKSCKEELLPTNPALIMAQCGSKGSLINVSQMVACVGQQAIRGQRVCDGYNGRSLPHFDYGDKSPVAKGFVSNSFFSGLTSIEFFFHTMAGREGLLDTAVKTAETGYMQRRLVKALEDVVSQYDGSVRNSYGEVVQLIYGDDGMDPAEIDSPSKFSRYPIDIQHLLHHSLASVPARNELSLAVPAAENLIDATTSKWSKIIDDEFRADLKKLIVNYLTAYKNTFNKRRTTRLCPTNELTRLTPSQLNSFMNLCWQKYNRARVEPGTAVGAICAQSVGEPATQMTLKTFHFAGVASMNITQGVPRIKELINANTTVSTPIIRVELLDSTDAELARRTKMRLELTTLGQVCSSISEIFSAEECLVEIVIDVNRIRLLRLDINMDQIEAVISQKLKIGADKFQRPIDERTNKPCKDRLLIDVTENVQLSWQLREQLGKIPIKGIPSVKRAMIRTRKSEETGEDIYYIVIEGEGLKDVMATFGVAFQSAYSNNVMEVAQVLGIEAAREVIIREIQETMSGHGIGIDERHLKLLADNMTYKGRVLGYTRHGMSKMKESALMLASFERTADHLFEAAYYGQKDPISGVSESIISGTPIRLGTGFFDLLYKPISNKNYSSSNSMSAAAGGGGSEASCSSSFATMNGNSTSANKKRAHPDDDIIFDW
uniref:DNA-directed RNA polymerase subunit n=1 Tax=Aceria tosichella TaxID=561515 RepID=A0A6G1S4K2_9ACAR